ncbi:MAG: hypothetical protein JWP13_677, partial [Candidatus Saccharibacteria bacterium]|nr:hypothetical protein [Candidatus Saccharibacteria bacterium]
MSVDKHPSVVVSNEGSRRFSLRWFRSLSPVKIAVIATVVLALLCGGTYYYFAHESTDDTAVTIPKRPDVAAANAPSAPLKPVDVSYVQLSDAELTSRVNLLISTKQYAEAEKLITMQND